MTPKAFWLTAPAKLRLLSEVHARVNDPRAKPKVARTVEEAGIMI